MRRDCPLHTATSRLGLLPARWASRSVPDVAHLLEPFRSLAFSEVTVNDSLLKLAAAALCGPQDHSGRCRYHKKPTVGGCCGEGFENAFRVLWTLEGAS